MAVTLTAVLTACSKTEEGTAEQAGKKIDQAMQEAKTYTQEKVDEAGQAMDQAGEDAKQAVSDAKEYTGEKMQEAGEAMEETGKEMQKDN